MCLTQSLLSRFNVSVHVKGTGRKRIAKTKDTSWFDFPSRSLVGPMQNPRKIQTHVIQSAL